MTQTHYVAVRPIVVAIGDTLVDALPGDVFPASALTEDDADDYLWAGWIKPAPNQKRH
ncbi:hypothetical protein [Aureimonas pseudogalii]|uniref:Uncharacterized protein n=1 Tax=Aureimonas pseudogalii TaxID=1744844 RepID=A0A7W6H5D4_9HYPH|nr:hypothetical protein [Aureimonas pseudogalii]MBB3998874.1 hypothetical protein [Aureimonas pseudogalii]